MANTTYDTIKNMKPAPWSRSTVADGNALNQNFLEPTHQKDLTLAAAIDQVKNTVDGYNETINNISNVADVAKTQATNAISAANEAQDAVEELQTTVTEMSDAVSAHGESIETLGNNFNTLSAAVAGEAEAITNLQNNKQDKIYVDANTISGNGTSGSPYTVIGGNQKELEFVDSTTVTVHKDEQDDKIIYSFSAAGGGGGGTSYDMAWYPTVDTDGKIEWAWNPTTSAPPTANIKGPQGQQGIQGPAGPQGPSGASGAKGEDGFSPTITTAGIEPTTEHPQGGTSVTITDKTGPNQFNVWNGINGEGASVNLLDGNGIHVQQDGINYTISVSADYSGAAVASAKNWVNAQGYVLSGALNPENSISGKWRNGQYYDFGLKASAENALLDVSKKTPLPPNNYSFAYAIWDNNDKEWVNPFYYFAPLLDEQSTVGTFYALVNDGTDIEWKGIDEYLEAEEYLCSTDMSANIGLSGSFDNSTYKYNFGIATTNMNPGRHYGFTTNGWAETDNWLMNRFQFENGVSGVPDMTNYKMHIGLSGDYLPTSGGTVSGQLEVHGGSNFDSQFIKLTREGNSCGARIGLGSDTTNGTLALKSFNAQGQNTVQVNIKYNANNNELIQVQKGGADVGFLIPAQVHQGSYTPASDDGILHIVLES